MVWIFRGLGRKLKKGRDSSALGRELSLSKEEEIKSRVELLSHNVEMDRMFNRG